MAKKARSKRVVGVGRKPAARSRGGNRDAGATPDQRDAGAIAAQLVEKLESLGSARVRTDMAERYGIRTPKAFGVSVGQIHVVAKDARTGDGEANHALAAALWDREWYEARMLACFVDEPALVTVRQMDRWCADFDNWGICDTACFHLFDRTPLAWGRVETWSTRKPEFEKRAAFALLASVALHDKVAEDGLFEQALPLIERGAADDRNFVKKAVSWALRSIGGRNAALHAEAVEVATRLADGPRGSAERWVGMDALRAFRSPAMARRVAKRVKESSAPSR